MNRSLCLKLLSLVVKPEGIVFTKSFEDHNTWTEAISNNISTKVFDYSSDEEHNPLIRCKDFTVVESKDQINRMEKFVGKVICKLDIDYNLIHVWFSRTDAYDLYTYLGCIKMSELHMEGIETEFIYN